MALAFVTLAFAGLLMLTPSALARLEARIAAEVVLMKTELERFREQVQNIE